jgi:hypothetical protein
MRRLKMQLKRFLEIREGLFFRVALAGNIDLKAPGDILVALAPHRRGKGSLHSFILSQ